MIAAMLSILLKKRISTKIAMTGEISLTGDIFPVGGLNEKLLAAKRVGIREVVLPHKNSNEISELPKELLTGLKLRKVKKVDEALKVVFGPDLLTRPKPAKVAQKRDSGRSKPAGKKRAARPEKSLRRV